MIVLSLKTDQALAEIALFKDSQKLDEIKWQAHRSLADTIHLKIKELLKRNKLDWDKIEGLICFKGPGSFTGLRIGLSVANALAYSLNCPIVAELDEDWQKQGIKNLLASKNEKIALPNYGQEANITKPKK